MGLAENLTISRIRRLAGSRYFSRGEGYLLGGRVVRLVEQNGQITATVAGTHDYRVRIWDACDGLDFSCDCPLGRRDEFCKHCVATALAWLGLQSGSAKSDGDNQIPRIPADDDLTTDDVGTWLKSLDKSALTELLLDAAAENERLHNRLMLKATAAVSANPATCKKLIAKAIGRGRFIDYHEMPEYWRRIDTAIDGIEEFADLGYAKDAIELCEYALKRVEKAIEHVDDSDGYMGELLRRLQEIHLRACHAARPDAVVLAERLFRWELEGDWDTFSGAVQTYADVFGEAGLQRYRELAEAVWNTVQPLEPGDDDPDRYGQRFRITQIMESLAQLSGDVEELVAVKQQDLSSSYAFLEIAEAYRRARKEDKALAWAEKGLRTFGGKADSRLKDLLAEMYHERERHDDAMALVWPQFEGSPNIGNYQKLKRNADRNGTWAEWRQRALNHIREFLDKNSSDIPAAHRRFSLWSDRSALVEIFLWENDPESAWEEASTGGCSDSLWLELANLRENDHPRDAIAVYQQLIVPIVNRTNNEAYAEAVALIRKIKSLMNSPAEQEEFRQYLTTLRTDFKRKRNLMKMLDTF
ncbi:MAG: DUF6880 family protein [Woeseia sp.]